MGVLGLGYTNFTPPFDRPGVVVGGLGPDTKKIFSQTSFLASNRYHSSKQIEKENKNDQD